MTLHSEASEGAILNYLAGTTDAADAGALRRIAALVAATQISGSPEGVTTAGIGTLVTDYTNGVLYIKASGTGNTGWVALSKTAGPTFTGTVVLPSTTSIGNVSSTEIGYVDGVTSSIQTQLNAKVGRNFLDNASFDVWQEGTSDTFAAGSRSYYTKADRWLGYRNAAPTEVALSQATTTTAGVGPHYAKIQRTAGTTDTTAVSIWTALESVDSAPLRGKTVTLSYWLRKGADWTPGVVANINTGTGTDQSAAAAGSWTGNAVHYGTLRTPTTSWVRYEETFTLSDTTNQIAVMFSAADFPAGTAGADDSVHITDVKLEVGSVATTFEHKSYAEELARCQRYYWNAVSGVGPIVGNGFYDTNANPSTSLVATVLFPAPMRIAPNPIVSNGTGHWYALVLDGSDAFATFDSSYYATTTSILLTASSSTGVSMAGGAGLPCVVRGNDAASSLGFTADL